MFEKPDIANDAIVKHLRDSYGLNAHEIRFLALGADVDAAAYRIETNEGRFFFKLRRTVSRDTLALASFLAEQRGTQVPAPLPARGYGPTATDSEALAYYRYERIVEDIALTCDHLLQSGEGGRDRALSLRYFEDAFRPNDVIEIADMTYASLKRAGRKAP